MLQCPCSKRTNPGLVGAPRCLNTRTPKGPILDQSKHQGSSMPMLQKYQPWINQSTKAPQCLCSKGAYLGSVGEPSASMPMLQMDQPQISQSLKVPQDPYLPKGQLQKDRSLEGLGSHNLELFLDGQNSDLSMTTRRTKS